MANAGVAIGPSSGRSLVAQGVRDADLDLVAASFEGWKVRLTQLAAGNGRGNLFETALPSMRLVSLRVETTTALEALPLADRPDDLFHVGTISAPGGSLVWHGASVRPGMLLLERGETLSSFRLPEGCELLVARLDRKRVESLCRLVSPRDAELDGPRSQLRPQQASVLAELSAQLRMMARGRAEGHPEWIRGAEDDLYERVAAMLAVEPETLALAPAARRRAVRRAEDYMEAHAGDRISLADLCRAADCCERTLRQGFREVYGTSPMTFLKKLRLQGLRRDLRDAAPRSTTVLQLALHWGFWHMGHLVGDYRSTFGETPSQTLAGGKCPSTSTEGEQPGPRVRPPMRPFHRHARPGRDSGA